MGKGNTPRGLMMTPATAGWLKTLAYKIGIMWRDWPVVIQLLHRRRDKEGGDEGGGTQLAVIQTDAGDPDGTEYAGDTGRTVDVNGADIAVPIDACVVKLAEDVGEWPDSDVDPIDGAVEKICRVPQLNGANAYFREPALKAWRVVDVEPDGDGVRLVGTVFNSWSDECDE